jgi:hypothetical protein
MDNIQYLDFPGLSKVMSKITEEFNNTILKTPQELTEEEIEQVHQNLQLKNLLTQEQVENLITSMIISKDELDTLSSLLI